MSQEPEKLMISTEKIINVIKNKSCIWDRMDAGYRDKYRRDKAWAEIYREIYPTFDDLTEGQKIKIGHQISKKWFNIRDAYVKTIKGPKKRPYIYSQAMSFLDPVILGETHDSQDFSEEQSLEGEPEIWLNESSFVDIDGNDKIPAKKSKLNSKDLEADNDTMVSFFTKMINREEDEDRAFFTSIIPSVKSLSDNDKLEFKIRVMTLLKQLKQNDANNKMFIKTNNSDSE